MTMVNIPSTKVDPDYRYKMPRLISKIEGRGNAIKTCIVNLGDVARALNCPPQYATMWFGEELGTKSHYIEKEGDGERCLIEGSHDISVFQDLLDQFIDKYMCCGDCRLPEVDLYISKGMIHGKCKACGWDQELDNKHRVAHFITKHPPDKSGLGMKGRRKFEKKAAKHLQAWDILFDDDAVTNDANSMCTEDVGKMKKEKKEKKHKKDKKEKKHKDQKEKKERSSSSKEDDDLSSKSEGERVSDEDAEDKRASSKSSVSEDGKALHHDWPSSKYEEEEPSDEETRSTQESSTEVHEQAFLSEDEKEAVPIEQVAKAERLEQIRRPAASLGKRYDSKEVGVVIETLRAFIDNSGAYMTVDDFYVELRLAQLAEVFHHSVRLYVALEALLGAKMDAESVLAHKDHIAKAITDASMSSFDVLWAFDAYIEVHPDTVKSFPMVLKSIYDEEWAAEEDILEYYGSGRWSSEPGFILAQSSAAPFLRWLSTSADDDEDLNDQ